MKIVVLFFCLVLLGPVFSTHAAAAESAAKNIYVKGVYSLPLSLDPIQMNDTASLVAGNLLYDGLLRFSPTLKLEGALAESWSTSPDGKTLTFKIRKSAKFHDGADVTAEDVVASLTRALAPESKVRKYYDCIEGADDASKATIGIQALDEKTLAIKLKHPFPPFLSVLAGATAKVLPKKWLTSKTFFDSPVGSGPFRFVAKVLQEKRLILEGFNGYYLGRPKLDQLVLQETTEAEALRFAEEGKIHDLASWPLIGSETVFNFGQKITSPVAATWIIGLNTKKAPFNSKQTRNNFRDSIDTEGFRKKFFPDAIASFGYVPPGLPGHVSSRRKNDNRKSTIKNKISIIIPEALSQHQEMKKFLEGNLREKGWNVEVVPMAWDKLMDGYVNKGHQAFLVSMNMDYPDAEFLLKNFQSSNPDNFSGLSDKRLDELLERARQSQDRQKRQALYKEAIELVDDSAVTVNIFHPRANVWASTCVQGLRPNILSDVYINYAQVSLTKDCGPLAKVVGP